MTVAVPIMFSKACESMSFPQRCPYHSTQYSYYMTFPVLLFLRLLRSLLIGGKIVDRVPVFIAELTCRAWLVAESHKRRTLQKLDVASAIAYSDMFDFLIDIVPRGGEVDGGEGALSGTEEGFDGDAIRPVDMDGDGDGDEGGVVRGEDGRRDEQHGDRVNEDGEAMYSEYVDGDG